VAFSGEEILNDIEGDHELNRITDCDLKRCNAYLTEKQNSVAARFELG
jgi:hypothetical protein